MYSFAVLGGLAKTKCAPMSIIVHQFEARTFAPEGFVPLPSPFAHGISAIRSETGIVHWLAVLICAARHLLVSSVCPVLSLPEPSHRQSVTLNRFEPPDHGCDTGLEMC
jgi:hypothetical protein